MIHHDPVILEKANTWLTDTFDEKTKNTIKELIAHNPEELADSFYKNLRVWHWRNERYYGSWH